MFHAAQQPSDRWISQRFKLNDHALVEVEQVQERESVDLLHTLRIPEPDASNRESFYESPTSKPELAR